MIEIVSPSMMQKIERAAMTTAFTSLTMMELAAGHVAQTAMEMTTNGEILCLCGHGNNGGDGFAAARILHHAGKNVRVAFVGDRKLCTTDTNRNLDRLLACGVELVTDYKKISPTLIIDALFGIGLTRAPEGVFYDAIDWVNQQTAKVLSVDIPSGIDARDGSVPSIAIKAQVTVCFHCLKVGHVLFPGRGLCGDVRVVPIGIATPESHDLPIQTLTKQDIKSLLPPRAADTHKGHYGRALLIAGSQGMAGAAVLCARGAINAGAGLLQIATTTQVLPIVQTLAPEATAYLLPTEQGAVAASCSDTIHELCRGKNAIVVGSGMSVCAGTREAVHAVLSSGVPSVIDADGITVLAQDLSLLSGVHDQVILTPHLGEMARLLGRTVKSPIDDAVSFAKQYGVVVLLKGASTIIASPDGRIGINLSGTPAMARGGSGDVLAGILAALLAQGLSAFEAAQLGAYLHGLAGQEAEKRHSLAMTAMDIPACLEGVFASVYHQ